MNKESNADKTAVIIRSPQTATVYLSSTKRPDHLSARAGLASKKGEGSNVEDSNTDEEEMAEDKSRPPSWVKDLILHFLFLFNILKAKIYKINICRAPRLSGC